MGKTLRLICVGLLALVVFLGVACESGLSKNEVREIVRDEVKEQLDRLDELVLSSLIIRNDDGRIVAHLGTVDGESTLFFHNRDGEIIVSLLSVNGEGSLTLGNMNGEHVASLGGIYGEGILFLADNDGNSVVSLGSVNGEGVILLKDAQGNITFGAP